MPPNHPLFVDQPLAVHLRGFYEDQLDEKDSIEAKLQSGVHLSMTDRMNLMSSLKEINQIFNIDEKGKSKHEEDPLTAYWNEQIERGEEPDLDMTLAELRSSGRI